MLVVLSDFLVFLTWKALEFSSQLDQVVSDFHSEQKMWKSTRSGWWKALEFSSQSGQMLSDFHSTRSGWWLP